MPRIILEGFSKQDYSVNLLHQFVDSDQKYQINSQLFCGTACLLRSFIFHLHPAPQTNTLASLSVSCVEYIERFCIDNDFCCFTYDIKLGDRGVEMAFGNAHYC
jgi:hypothetical protein